MPRQQLKQPDLAPPPEQLHYASAITGKTYHVYYYLEPFMSDEAREQAKAAALEHAKQQEAEDEAKMLDQDPLALFKYWQRKWYSLGNNYEQTRSKSPYAITQQDPTMRIMKTPIVRGGLFWTDTHVQTDHIYTCPVTGREFTDDQLDSHRRGLDRIRDHWAAVKTKDPKIIAMVEGRL